MFKIKEKINILISLPKTIYFNFKVLPFNKAIKLPFFIQNDVELGNLYKGCIFINDEIEKFMVKIGIRWKHDGVPELGKTRMDFAKNSKLIFRKNVEIACGTTIKIGKNATIAFGEDFFCNKNCNIVSEERIEFGDEVLIGWNVSIRDNDGGNHCIIKNGIVKENKKKITVGNHVWICACVSLLKGIEIPDNCVVAYNSCVNKQFVKENTLIAGYPAKVIEERIEWKR